MILFLASKRQSGHQILRELCLVLSFLVIFLLIVFATLDVHENVVLVALKLINLLLLLFNHVLMVLDLLHHGRTRLVKLVNVCLVLFLNYLPLLVVLHG